MSEYFNLYNIFISIGAFATIFFILKLIIFAFTGGDTEVHSDFDNISDTDTSFNFISLQSILAFLMGFGWSGLAAVSQFDIKGRFALLIALLIGFIFMYLSAYLMFSIKKLNKIVKVDLNELVNNTGKAYTSFEPKAIGQIQINVNNKLSILDAINLNDEKIEAFSDIKVIKVENKQIFITKI